MEAYFSIKEVGKRWDELPQRIVIGTNWIDIVDQVKNTLKTDGKNEARLSDTKGYNNQGYYINQ